MSRTTKRGTLIINESTTGIASVRYNAPRRVTTLSVGDPGAEAARDPVQFIRR